MHPVLRRRWASLLTVLLAVVTVPNVARAARLWIVWDSSEVQSCRSLVEDYYACVIGASNFNTLTSGFGGGETLSTVAGTAVITGCTAVDDCFNNPAHVATFQCVEDQTHFPLMPGDVVLFFPPMLSCSDGCNDHNITVHTPSGDVPIRGAYAFTGGSCNCQTALGFHELYEATGDASAADFCNHMAGAGWYSLDGCDGTQYRSQLFSPPGGSGSCNMLQVDASALCSQPRAVRTRGMCMNGNLVTCALGPTVDDCHGLGCDDSPMPHCRTFGAQCQITAPTMLCSGAAGDVAVTCTNSGAIPWDAGLQIGTLPPGRASLFADTSWISTSVAAAIEPSSVMPMATGSFHFRLHAPTVTGPITYSLAFGLLEAAGGYYPSPPAPAITADLTVLPCPDAGRPDAGSVDARVGDASPTLVHEAGCGCRTVSTAMRVPTWAALSLALVALGFASRRGRIVSGRGGASSDAGRVRGRPTC